MPNMVVYAYTLPLHRKLNKDPKEKKKKRERSEKRVPKRVHRAGASKPCGTKATAWYRRNYTRNEIGSLPRNPTIERLAFGEFFGW